MHLLVYLCVISHIALPSINVSFFIHPNKVHSKETHNLWLWEISMWQNKTKQLCFINALVSKIDMMIILNLYQLWTPTFSPVLNKSIQKPTIMICKLLDYWMELWWNSYKWHKEDIVSLHWLHLTSHVLDSLLNILMKWVKLVKTKWDWLSFTK